MELQKRGADHVGRCPFHDDQTPSLSVSPSKNLWRCFGACDTGGDVIAWVQRREGVSFRHAVELLKGDYVPAAKAAAPVARSTTVKLAPIATPAEDAALLGEVVGYYHAALAQTPEALAYLERRGLTHPELIDAFRLGFADRTLGYRLPSVTTKAGLDVRARLKGLGVLRESGHEHLRGSLVIPILDAEGRVANLYGRKIRDDLRAGTPDHLYLPGPHRGVFNVAAFAASEELILTEALIDALTFWRAVDDEGEVLDVLVQKRRNTAAAMKLLRKLLKFHGIHPETITTDKLGSYRAAAKKLNLTDCHRPGGMHANNRAENSHLPIRRRERKMLKFKSQRQAQRFLSTHGPIYNTFNHQPHLISRPGLRRLRAGAYYAWAAATQAA